MTNYFDPETLWHDHKRKILTLGAATLIGAGILYSNSSKNTTDSPQPTHLTQTEKADYSELPVGHHDVSKSDTKPASLEAEVTKPDVTSPRIKQLSSLIDQYKTGDEVSEFDKKEGSFSLYIDPITKDAVNRNEAKKIALTRQMVIGEAELYKTFARLEQLGDLSNWNKTAEGNYEIPNDNERLDYANNTDPSLIKAGKQGTTFTEAEAIAFAKVYREGAKEFHKKNSRARNYEGQNEEQLRFLVDAQERSTLEMLLGIGKYAGDLSAEEKEIAEENAIYAISDIQKGAFDYKAGLQIYQGGDLDKITAKIGANPLTQSLRKLDDKHDNIVTSAVTRGVELFTFFPNRVVVNTDRLLNGKKNLTEVTSDRYGYNPQGKVMDPVIECITVDIDGKQTEYKTENLPAQRMNDGRLAYGAVLTRDALLALGMYNTFAGSSSGGSGIEATPEPTGYIGPGGNVIY